LRVRRIGQHFQVQWTESRRTQRRHCIGRRLWVIVQTEYGLTLVVSDHASEIRAAAGTSNRPTRTVVESTRPSFSSQSGTIGRTFAKTITPNASSANDATVAIASTTDGT